MRAPAPSPAGLPAPTCAGRAGRRREHRRVLHESRLERPLPGDPQRVPKALEGLTGSETRTEGVSGAGRVGFDVSLSGLRETASAASLGFSEFVFP